MVPNCATHHILQIKGTETCLMKQLVMFVYFCFLLPILANITLLLSIYSFSKFIVCHQLTPQGDEDV